MLRIFVCICVQIMETCVGIGNYYYFIFTNKRYCFQLHSMFRSYCMKFFFCMKWIKFEKTQKKTHNNKHPTTTSIIAFSNFYLDVCFFYFCKKKEERKEETKIWYLNLISRIVITQKMYEIPTKKMHYESSANIYMLYPDKYWTLLDLYLDVLSIALSIYLFWKAYENAEYVWKQAIIIIYASKTEILYMSYLVNFWTTINSTYLSFIKSCLKMHLK